MKTIYIVIKCNWPKEHEEIIAVFFDELKAYELANTDNNYYIEQRKIKE